MSIGGTLSASVLGSTDLAKKRSDALRQELGPQLAKRLKHLELKTHEMGDAADSIDSDAAGQLEAALRRTPVLDSVKLLLGGPSTTLTLAINAGYQLKGGWTFDLSLSAGTDLGADTSLASFCSARAGGCCGSFSRPARTGR